MGLVLEEASVARAWSEASGAPLLGSLTIHFRHMTESV